MCELNRPAFMPGIILADAEECGHFPVSMEDRGKRAPDRPLRQDDYQWVGTIGPNQEPDGLGRNSRNGTRIENSS